MVRSLWTAASGMISQQTNIDTISNNLANINTTGYKKETTEFKSLLYQTMQKDSTDSNGDVKPVGIQVGLGVRNSAITSQYTQGSLTETGNDYDFAIDGDGFFMIRTADGSTQYTRNGSFNLTLGANGLTLADANGNHVLDSTGSTIEIPVNYAASKITFDEFGNVYYEDAEGQSQPLGKQIGIAQFNNPAGLEKTSNSLLKVTAASGEARIEGTDANLKRSKVLQRYLESSNVQAIDEMVNLIVAQRAYEMSSKAITASDEMLQQANNLRR